MNKFKAGDVVFVNLGNPNTSEIKGREQGNARPCLVIKSLHTVGLVIIIPFTSKKPKSSFFPNVKVEKDHKLFSQDSYALCHQIRTISLERIEHKMGRLSEIDNDKIRFVLMDFLDLD